MIRTYLISILLIFSYSLLYPQSAKVQQPITISIFSESTSIPFTTLPISPIHPGIQTGTEFRGHYGKYIRLFPAINIGYMFHKNLFQGLYINAELGFDIQTKPGINLKSKIGLGYLHTFTTKQEFRLVDGKYENKADAGNSRLMPSLTLGVGYKLRKSDINSPEIFVLYQSWLEYPYSPGFIPLMSHTSIHLGSKFYPFKTKNIHNNQD